jgi:hypothetical protein
VFYVANKQVQFKIDIVLGCKINNNFRVRVKNEIKVVKEGKKL